jgi:mRNA interferase YafQ
MAMIIWEEPLPAKYREHNLSGDYTGYAECHVEGDLLLIYRLSSEKVLFFAPELIQTCSKLSRKSSH